MAAELDLADYVKLFEFLLGSDETPSLLRKLDNDQAIQEVAKAGLSKLDLADQPGILSALDAELQHIRYKTIDQYKKSGGVLFRKDDAGLYLLVLRSAEASEIIRYFFSKFARFRFVEDILMPYEPGYTPGMSWRRLHLDELRQEIKNEILNLERQKNLTHGITSDVQIRLETINYFMQNVKADGWSVPSDVGNMNSRQNHERWLRTDLDEKIRDAKRRLAECIEPKPLDDFYKRLPVLPMVSGDDPEAEICPMPAVDHEDD